MTTYNYPIRILGGRNASVIYDDGAETLSIMGQSINISALSAALQQQWFDTVAVVSSSVQTAGLPAFGGDNVGAVIGEILAQNATWRAAVGNAVAAYVSMVTFGGLVGDPETIQH